MITLEEIIFNSLMPWHCRNRDNFPYEELNAELIPVSHYGPGGYFTKLPGPFTRLVMNPSPQLAAEWKAFAEAGLTTPEGLLKIMASCRHPHPKVRFYGLLLSMIAHAETGVINKFVKANPADHHRRYKLAHHTTRLERIITISNPDTDHREENLIIVQLVKFTAIFIYLEILTRYCRHIQPERLKLTPDAIYEQLAMIRMSSEFATVLADKLLQQYETYFTRGIEAYIGRSTAKRRSAGVACHSGRTTKSAKNDILTPDGRANAQQEHEANDATERMIESGEVMKLLGISKSTLKRYRDNGTVPFSQPAPNGKFFYKYAEIKALAKTIKKNNKVVNESHFSN